MPHPVRSAGQDLRHHNPFLPGDRGSLMSAMEDNAAKDPGKTLDAKLSTEDGDLVAIYPHVRQNPQDPGAAAVHIFRFRDGTIAELWDAGQAIPRYSPNLNGAFRWGASGHFINPFFLSLSVKSYSEESR